MERFVRPRPMRPARQGASAPACLPRPALAARSWRRRDGECNLNFQARACGHAGGCDTQHSVQAAAPRQEHAGSAPRRASSRAAVGTRGRAHVVAGECDWPEARLPPRSWRAVPPSRFSGCPPAAAPSRRASFWPHACKAMNEPRPVASDNPSRTRPISALVCHHRHCPRHLVLLACPRDPCLPSSLLHSLLCTQRLAPGTRHPAPGTGPA